MGQKGEGRANSAYLFLSWESLFSCPWRLEPWALAHSDLGLHTCVPLVLRPLNSDWITPPAFLVLRFARARPWSSLVSMTTRVNSNSECLVIYLSIHGHLCVLILFFWRTLIQLLKVICCHSGMKTVGAQMRCDLVHRFVGERADPVLACFKIESRLVVMWINFQ